MNASEKLNLMELLNVAGLLPTAINGALNQAVEANNSAAPVHSKLLAAHTFNDRLGKALQNLQIAIQSIAVDADAYPEPPENLDVPGTGEFQLHQYTKEDATFLYWFNQAKYTPATGRQDLVRDAFKCTHLEASQLINAGFPGVYIDGDSGDQYKGSFRTIAEATLAKYQR